jgi:hypothetical protein
MSDNNNPDALWLMLGEIRGDLKWLVEDRRSTSRRMDDIEAGIETKIDEHDGRLQKLENFKLRIGVFATAVGIVVPTAITIITKKLGLL